MGVWTHSQFARSFARAAQCLDEPLLLFPGQNPVIAELRLLDVNALSPLAALNKLYELKQRARG